MCVFISIFVLMNAGNCSCFIFFSFFSTVTENIQLLAHVLYLNALFYIINEIIFCLLIYLNGAKLLPFYLVVWSIFATFALSLRQRDLLNHEVLRIEKEAK